MSAREDSSFQSQMSITDSGRLAPPPPGLALTTTSASPRASPRPKFPSTTAAAAASSTAATAAPSPGASRRALTTRSPRVAHVVHVSDRRHQASIFGRSEALRWPPAEDIRWGPAKYPPFALPANSSSSSAGGDWAVLAGSGGACDPGLMELRHHAPAFFEQIKTGSSHAALGEFEEAGSCYRLALRSALRAGSTHGEAVACGNLALVSKQLGDQRVARQWLARYMELTQKLSAQQAKLTTRKIEAGVANGHRAFREHMLDSFGAMLEHDE